MRPSRAQASGSSRLPQTSRNRALDIVVSAVVTGAVAGWVGYQLGLRQGTKDAAPVAGPPRTGTPDPEPHRQAAAGDPHFKPRTVEARTGNFLANAGFEDGTTGWSWLDWSNDWAPFAVDELRAAAGTRAAHLTVTGRPQDRPTRVFGVVQELAPAVFPTEISGRYFVERWEPGGAKKAYVQVVIIAMWALGDLPSRQLRYILEGVTEQPYNMSNARYVFVNRRAQPETGRWLDFKLDVQGDYRRLWGDVPPDGTPFRVLFESRYDDKPLGSEVRNVVFYDELFVGVP